MKIKKNTKKILLVLFFSLLVLVPIMASSIGTYKPMEEIPGYTLAAPYDFFDYIAIIYRFGIGAVGIAAMIMLSIGGFMYITSAGNNASMEKAKGVITDAIVGLLLALSAYIILYTINPDLVKLRKPTVAPIPLSVVTPPGAPGAPGVPPPGGLDPAQYPCAVQTPACRVAQSGACAPANFAGTCLASSANKASVICQKESSGIASIASGVDKCVPGGESVSYGLFQINLTANNVAGLNCTGSVGPLYTAQNHTCSVTNPTVFNQCVAAARDPTTNIQAACSISNGGTSWSRWGASSGPSGCRC
ncbi:MAG: hypothetical protein AAB487_00160 [Patescibacteria group bacterium]